MKNVSLTTVYWKQNSRRSSSSARQESDVGSGNHQGIPQKGALLTYISCAWFNLLQSLIPTLRTHFVSHSIPIAIQQKLPSPLLLQLEHRCMQVHRLKVFPSISLLPLISFQRSHSSISRGYRARLYNRQRVEGVR